MSQYSNTAFQSICPLRLHPETSPYWLCIKMPDFHCGLDSNSNCIAGIYTFSTRSGGDEEVVKSVHKHMFHRLNGERGMID